jgi:NADH-quinone oxidoreductase subunit N
MGKAAVLYYLLAYGVTNLAAFALIALLGTRERGNDDLKDMAGLAASRPGMAALMTVFLLSLGGFPPTAGFIAKWYIFSAAIGTGHYALAIIGVLSSVVSVFFYLRIVVMMYMAEPAAGTLPAPSRFGILMLGVSMLAVFYLGILPARVLGLAAGAVGGLLP